ncbi:hypothetical protein GGR56DRAFT_671239 [Xylariaceae sp. FL0804]|nr:hypothetical protein GGR56DRAFT_671239 [Xylariaceae sp. FL0804]
MDTPLSRELSLYNGVSNRSRGWKTKRSGRIMEPSSSNPRVMRWDGASRSSAAWDNLRRDPELWYRDGNCYIHLYGQGQSRRGPAFKVPFSTLLEAKCFPFIDRFMANDAEQAAEEPQHDDRYQRSYFSRTQRRSRIELFVPAPPQSDKRQAYNYHLATRNFIAFIFRRSMVGENLGSALITLMHSLHEFRSGDVDNLQGMLSYLDEEGYLSLKSQPSHALAILHLAEVFQLQDLYIDAFSHCCGMSDQLFLGPEHQFLCTVTRKLIRRARVEMDRRLGQCGSMLSTFLQDELSEAHLGLYHGARAHLERFRTLLHGLYAARFGYYPPPSIDSRTTIFEIDVFRVMRDDFEALYQYLVDESFDATKSSPFLAQGGICTLQSVQAFDERHKFPSLFHPLPLLPNLPQESTSARRLSWLGKPSKPAHSRRSDIHVALVRATNRNKPELLQNDLVQAYRRFEEDSVCSPMRADKLENLGPMDARKVRWILVYAMYQTLRQATEPPAEVKDAVGVPYHLCVPTTNLPPWQGHRPIHTLVRTQTAQVTRSPSTSTASSSSSRGAADSLSSPSSTPSFFEIKPDIDYLALTQQASAAGRSAGLSRNQSFTGSLVRTLSRSSNSARRPFGLFASRGGSTERLGAPSQLSLVTPNNSKATAPYHEIVVDGYGNGTRGVDPVPVDVAVADAAEEWRRELSLRNSNARPRISEELLPPHQHLQHLQQQQEHSPVDSEGSGTSSTSSASDYYYTFSVGRRSSAGGASSDDVFGDDTPTESTAWSSRHHSPTSYSGSSGSVRSRSSRSHEQLAAAAMRPRQQTYPVAKRQWDEHALSPRSSTPQASGAGPAIPRRRRPYSMYVTTGAEQQHQAWKDNNKRAGMTNTMMMAPPPLQIRKPLPQPPPPLASSPLLLPAERRDNDEYKDEYMYKDEYKYKYEDKYEDNENEDNNEDEIDDRLLEMPRPRFPTAWDYIKAVMEVKATSMIDDIQPEWEQYTDLGGLTELKAEPEPYRTGTGAAAAAAAASAAGGTTASSTHRWKRSSAMF